MVIILFRCNNNNNNNNQYIYKQRQNHAVSQRRWLATAVIFRPSDVSLGFVFVVFRIFTVTDMLMMSTSLLCVLCITGVN